MTTKHTPGTWHLANGVQIRIEKHQIAKGWMMRNGEGNSNARLLAAAPETAAERDKLREQRDGPLNALRVIAAHHEEQRELWSEGWDGDEVNARYHEHQRDFALAAIAKAGGAA